MYSPKIEEELIPILYHTAKDRGIHMTGLVNSLIVDGLLRDPLPDTAREMLSVYIVNKHCRDHPEEQEIPSAS